jgi:hypothetical protein
MAQQLCTLQRIIDPTERCLARSVPGRETCLAHTANVSNILDCELVNVDLIELDLLSGLEINSELLSVLLDRQEVVGSKFSHATFTGPTNFGGREFTGAVDFYGASFVEDAQFSFVTFTTAARFDKAIFTGDASFYNTVFMADAVFSNAIFAARAFFLDATFAASAYFDLATFTGDVAFSSVAGDARFYGATFATTASFMAVGFGGAADFCDATFACDVTFHGATFATGAHFLDATFAGDAEFKTTETSKGGVDMSRATFKGVALIQVRTALKLDGLTIRDPLTVTAVGEGAAIVSLERCTLEAPLIVGDGVSLAGCKLSFATGLDNLRVLGSGAWGEVRRRQAIADEPPRSGSAAPTGTYGRVESSYRQLRSALESSKDYAGAADFYYGEMEMRRLGTPRLSVERPLLFGYKITAGYGLRAYRAFATYAAVVFGSALLLHSHTRKLVVFEAVMNRDGTAVVDSAGKAVEVAKAAGSAGLHFDSFWDCVAISLRSTVSFLSPVTDGLTGGGTVLFVAMKIAGPLLFGLAALALRSRVQR